ncbi:MAG: hypothetical protein V7723_07525 [Sneathiella sp.]|uniref:hypothetical protein n=1 Tax=Sneathiella sp. TaxID=1964365 RepID=UPI003001D162
MAARIDERTQFEDDGGLPIVDGKIYIGVVGLDPKLNPLGIFSNRELTDALANPQSTDAFGRSLNKIWVPGRYSILVEDAAGVQKLLDLDSGTLGNVGYTAVYDVLGTNAITGTASTTISSYVDLQAYVLKIFADNDGSATLDIDGVGATPITKYGDQPLSGGELKQGEIRIFVRNESNDRFELQDADAEAIITLITANTAAVAANTAEIALRAYPPEYFNGCLLSSNAVDGEHDIDVTAGRMRDSTDTINIVIAAQTVQCDVVFGTGSGILEDSLTLLLDTEYYPFAIAKAAGADPKLFLFNAADPSADLPTDYLYFRALNDGKPLLTDGSANLVNTFHGEFTSPPQTISNAGDFDLPHGLGGFSTALVAFLICTTDSEGFVAGEKIPVALGHQSSSVPNSITLIETATNIKGQFAAYTEPFIIPHATTGANASLTNANFDFYVRAWA